MNAMTNSFSRADVDITAGAHGYDEVALWRAVVLQAFKDAVKVTPGGGAGKKDTRVARQRVSSNRMSAIAWLKSFSPDFIDVCTRADLEPDTIRRMAIEMLDQGATHLAERFRDERSTSPT